MRRLIAASFIFALGACTSGKHAPEGADLGDESSATTAAPSPIHPSEHHVALFNGTTTSYAYALHGTAGQSISIYDDGGNGLDTVVYLYKISRITGRPYGRP